jgi:uncharacterized protein
VQVGLDEGPRLTANVVNAGTRSLAIGARVEAVFDRIDDEIALPRFRLID